MMTRTWTTLMLLATLTAAADEAALEARITALEKKIAEGSANTLDARWKNGFRLSSSDGDFELRPRVLLQTDAAWFFGEDDVNAALAAGAEEGEDPDQIENGAEFRRARMGFEGLIYQRIEFEFMYDFSGGDAEPKDVYAGIREIPFLGTVRIGHQKEPFSRLQGSDSQRTFMEKGLEDVLAPDRSLGVRFLNHLDDGRLAWSGGAFYLTDDDGSSIGEKSYALTARMAGLPWRGEKEARLLVVSLAGSYRHPGDEELDYGARPESHLAEDLIDRASFTSDEIKLLGAESALQQGAFALVGEWVIADVSNINGDSDATFDGYEVSGSYFLTGEHRSYDEEEGRLGRVAPNRNWGDGGCGAWEIAIRASEVDLTDAEFGEMSAYTAALNWYLNPSARVMLNYVYADAESAGDLHVVEARVQLDI